MADEQAEQAGVVRVLELVEIEKRYGTGDGETPALRGLSLSLVAGEFVAVMGPSGSGKSTLVHVAAGLEAADAGSVLIDGRLVAADDRRAWTTLRRTRIGVVFQRLNLMPGLTAIENVMVPLELDNRSRRASQALAREALKQCGVDGVADRYPDALSGGQQQRVAIARALVGDRSILLADEPTGALDSVAQEKIVELLAARASDGAAVLMVTHDSRLASWADRVVYVRDGTTTEGAGGAPTVVGSGAPPVGAGAGRAGAGDAR